MHQDYHGLVSVIVIYHNEAEFISEAVASVVSQTYKHWELILVDDASSDNSTESAMEVLAEDRHSVRVIKTSSDRTCVGMSKARNFGLAAATGDFIAFLDGDDVWLPYKLSEQVILLKSNQHAEAVYGRTTIWLEWEESKSKEVVEDYYYSLGVAADKIYHPPALCRLLIENKWQSPTTCNVMYRASFFQKYGGFDDRYLSTFEDQIVYFKLFLNCPVFVSSRVWAKYRQHVDSSSTEFTNSSLRAQILARLNLIQWSLEYIQLNRSTLPDGMERINALLRQESQRLRRGLGLRGGISRGLNFLRRYKGKLGI